MKRNLRVVLVVFLFFCLIMVRALQAELFYDPLQDYFQNDYLYLPIPNIENKKLFFSYFSRYSINTILSMIILRVAFGNDSFSKTVLLFYVFAFVLLSSVFFGLIFFQIDLGHLFLFYLRRFIIYPVFVLVLLPYLYVIHNRENFVL